jgi:hypothetical protein
MSRVIWMSILVTVAAVLLPSTALGKGASEATITGPGLSGPISLAGEGQAGGEELMNIAVEGGFFAAVFTQIPDPMLDERPDGALGPKYVVEYVMPGPNSEEDTLLQDLYPYATPSPVTYVEPAQHFWTTEETRGGWFVATPTLKSLLVSAGLPETAPVDDAAPSDPPWAVLVPLLVLVALAALGVLAAVVTRRRPQTV